MLHHNKTTKPETKQNCNIRNEDIALQNDMT